MKHFDDDEATRKARHDMVRKQARVDPVCAELLALNATLSLGGGGPAYIPTMIDYDDDCEDFRPY